MSFTVRPLEVGDRVTDDSRDKGTIRFIEDNEAVVLMDHGGGLYVRYINQLKRIPDAADDAGKAGA